MTKLKIITTIVTLLTFLCASTGCAATSFLFPSRMDKRFLRLEGPILGLTVKEVVEKIGQPDSKVSEECKVPLRDPAGVRFIHGESWSYTVIEETFVRQLQLCIIKNRVLGEGRRFIDKADDLITDHTEEMYDLGLIEEVYFGKQRLEKPRKESDSELVL